MFLAFLFMFISFFPYCVIIQLLEMIINIIRIAHTSKSITGLFDDMYDLDFFFLQLQQLTGTRLYENVSYGF